MVLEALAAMFKKCVSSGSHTQLSKSDAKKLRKAAAETMGVDEALLERSGLMPPKSDVVVGKLNNAKVYCVNDQPLFFDPNGKGCLLYTSPSPRDATLSRMPSSA